MERAAALCSLLSNAGEEAAAGLGTAMWIQRGTAMDDELGAVGAMSPEFVVVPSWYRENGREMRYR